MTKSVNGTVYEISGSESAPVITLIHGLGINRQLWDDYVPVLSRNYRVLAYDLYGHGESIPPPEVPSLKLFSKQLKGLLEELQINKSVILGFSLGGMINRRFTMDFPEFVQALIILNSPHERDPDEQKIIEERVVQTAEGGPEGTLETSLERWFTPEFRSESCEVVDKMRKWILHNDPGTYTQCREVLAKGVKELIRPYPPIEVPALVMTCENDSGSTPEMSYGISSEIKGAKTVIIPKLQHVGLMEKPNLFLYPISRFLDGIFSRKN